MNATKLITAIACTALLVACAGTQTQTSASRQISSSADLRSRLALLDEQQNSYIFSAEPLRLFASEAKLIDELMMRTPEQNQQFVADMMQTTASLAWRPGIDMGEIPLNRENAGFNSGTTVRPAALWKYKRDFGPIHLSRYIGGGGGIPTFAGAPVAVFPEDLIAGKVDIAIAGVPQSLSSGTRDSDNGPKAMRLMHGIADRNLFTLQDPHAYLNIVDYGNFTVDRMLKDRTIEHISDMVGQILATGTTPFLVGGDFSVSYSSIKAIAEHHGGGVTVVHLGAHFNAEAVGAHQVSDRDVFYKLITDNNLAGGNLIQLGLRGPQAGADELMWLRDQGVRYHTMAAVERNGWEAVMERVLDEASEAELPVYISFDVSVLDPSQLPAAGRAVPGGLTMREVLPLIRRLCSENDVAGFEILDLAPMLDLSYTSALNANYVMNPCLAGVALNKSGITSEAGYLSPLTLDHGAE
ncbi:MAG: agmatinase family protein [Gammaproteobacteria bacterium]|nr:agmatinase family protein [Gammaproteobacteria bacterium]